MINFKELKEENLTGGNGNYIKFGLNTGKILSVYYTPKGGYKGEEVDALVVEWQVGDTKKDIRFFPIPDDYPYDAKKASDVQGLRIKNILKIFVPEETVNKVMSNNYNSFKEFYQTVDKCLKAKAPNMAEVDVDFFFNYQLNIAPNNNQTYLEIDNAKTSYKGNSYVKHVEGDFKQVIDDSGLHFVTDDGKVHPISRNKWFTQQNYMKKQTLENVSKPQSSTSSGIDDLPFGGDDSDNW